jgi:hypothetical protein
MKRQVTKVIQDKPENETKLVITWDAGKRTMAAKLETITNRQGNTKTKAPKKQQQPPSKKKKKRQEEELQVATQGKTQAKKKGLRVRFFLPKRSGRSKDPPEMWEDILSPVRPPRDAYASYRHPQAAPMAISTTARWEISDYRTTHGRHVGGLEGENEGLSTAHLRLMRSPVGSFRGTDDEDDEEEDDPEPLNIGRLLNAQLIATPPHTYNAASDPRASASHLSSSSIAVQRFASRDGEEALDVAQDSTA